MNKCDRVAGVGAFRETTWLRSRRLQPRLPSGLSELAVLFWRVGKDFFTSLAVCGALEKSCAARWRAVTCWKRLFWRAGGLRRVGKDFFGALEGYGALEKSFLRRWRPPAAWKSLFQDASGRIGRGKVGFACVFMSQVSYWPAVGWPGLGRFAKPRGLVQSDSSPGDPADSIRR